VFWGLKIRKKIEMAWECAGMAGVSKSIIDQSCGKNGKRSNFMLTSRDCVPEQRQHRQGLSTPCHFRMQILIAHR
jgi:hypothetical protein